MERIPKWKQLHFRAVGDEAGRPSDLLRETANALDELGEITVSDMTFHTVLTDNAEFRPVIDVYYAFDNDVEVAGPVPAASNIVYHASQAHPAGIGRDGTAELLKKFADETVGCLGDATIENVVFNPPIDDGDVDRSMTVYYTTTE